MELSAYPPPRLIFWETTAGCNLACIHCRRMTVADQLLPQDLKTQEAFDLIDQVAPADLPRPGDMVTAEITYAAPHHLVADAGVLAVRRTRAGDAWERRTATPDTPPSVGLGMPAVGVPAPLPAAAACG